MRRRPVVAALVAALVVVPLAAGLVAGGGVARAERRLTADDVAARARDTSLAVAARAAEVRAAEAALGEARVAWLPRLAGRARYARLSDIDPRPVGIIVVAERPGPVAGQELTAQVFAFPSVTNDISLSATLEVPLSDYLLRTPHATGAADRQRQAAEASRAASALQVGADGRLLYYAWARAELQRQVAEKALAQAEAHLVEVQAAVAAQTATLADRLRVESQRASAERLLERARHLGVLLADQLHTALHDGGAESYALGEDLDAEPPPIAGLGSVDDVWREALASRPELAELASAEAAVAEQGQVARAASWPRLDAFAELLAAQPNPRYFPPRPVLNTTWAVGMQLAWSPNDLLSSSAVARAAGAQAEARRAQRALAAEQIRTEVVRAFQARVEAETARATTARGLAAAEEAYRIRRELFRAGRATSVELTDAETDLTRARLDAIDARLDARVARVQLLRAAGRP